MTDTQTPFVETEILLALLDADLERAVELVKAMLPRERQTLYRAATTLERLTSPHHWCAGCNNKVRLSDTDLRVVAGLTYHRSCLDAKRRGELT